MSRLLLGAALALALLGGAAGHAPAADPLRVVAYINVTSACQQSTVDLLQRFAAEAGSQMKLDLVDFGDGGAGSRRWQTSGYTCMTIELNGSPHVQFPLKGATKAVSFQMPAGFYWVEEELLAALRAGVAGTLRTLTAQQMAAALAQAKPTATVAKMPRGGKTFYQVVVNHRPILSIAASANGKTAAGRTQAAAAALNAWLARPVKTSEVATRKGTTGWVLMAGGRNIAVATAADAKLANSTGQKLVAAWATALRQAIAPR